VKHTIHHSAEIDSTAIIGAGTSVWQFSHVREYAEIGSECVIGRNVYIGPGVKIGDRCKLQNLAMIYEPATIEDGVFIGPGVVFTNDLHPRSITPNGRLKSPEDWDRLGVRVQEGASIGASATCVAPVSIGRWALVAAGSVVVSDVPDYALVAGVPARQIGWVGPAGKRLVGSGNSLTCPETGQTFLLVDETLCEVKNA
jgi:UDP-2-acetamido-3-amino-2,3-dideoxy-glucuronate N-acetyltransferase